MHPTLVRFTLLACLLGILSAGCAPAPAPGEKDRERGEEALDRLPK